jgi:hypothetical protein
MSNAAENPAGRVVRLNLGADAVAELDWGRRVLCIQCASGELMLKMRLEPVILGDYAGSSGSLALATWMVMKLQCSPEDAIRLVETIGPRVMSDFVFTDG